MSWETAAIERVMSSQNEADNRQDGDCAPRSSIKKRRSSGLDIDGLARGEKQRQVLDAVAVVLSMVSTY